MWIAIRRAVYCGSREVQRPYVYRPTEPVDVMPRDGVEGQEEVSSGIGSWLESISYTMQRSSCYQGNEQYICVANEGWQYQDDGMEGS